LLQELLQLHLTAFQTLIVVPRRRKHDVLAGLQPVNAVDAAIVGGSVPG